MAPKRKYQNYQYSRKQTQYEHVAEFRTKRSINFFTDGDRAYQAVLTFMNEEPLVGLQKLYYDEKSSAWKPTKKGIFMGQDAWNALGARFAEIRSTFQPLFNEPPTTNRTFRPPPPEVGLQGASSSSTETTATPHAH